eukprot:CAMPEP_0184687688 /NCGR_PEP_ID=MMETSP0312-20130426/27294_1 /TAXON_ID=31354 /ORGANISM="Compsopogon coeruleus, Strain SAG 36.94" /LENGTH=145 /DNA_ID=CAMNT_0027144097 /DNA_START=94 /DNA_END=531 /DNA_ORIENTATION=+
MSAARFMKRYESGGTEQEITDESVKAMTAARKHGSAPERVRSKVNDPYKKSGADGSGGVDAAVTARSRAAVEAVRKEAAASAVVKKPIVVRSAPAPKVNTEDSAEVQELKRMLRLKDEEIQGLLKKIKEMTDKMDHVVRILDPQK